eukprot:CAMPEP_0114445106 /NCGR_PEP_ID=MMETSP0103-20121206/18442_1 /TAXON_ID=37642 ORGANISM="Paraphysomonas imperforata, Strain PA2" /NCGR_SAMPLE_ID=MMETSP0103 /ASSEMBLY_ACC=CAM_ASM_000201 /LENGTH=1976 /DNA_ID=CAMNT_0001616687 /DNA_START=129 /DNA_END=6060 /DNA_ORIENTATION=+
MRRRSVVKIISKEPQVSQEDLEREAQKKLEVEEAMRLVQNMDKFSTLELAQGAEITSSPTCSPKGFALNKFKNTVKKIQRVQQVNKSIKGLLNDKRRAQEEQRQKDEVAMRKAEKERGNQEQDLRFDRVLESEARVMELFKLLDEEENVDDDDGYGEPLADVTDVQETSYDLKLGQDKIEDILESMNAMKFNNDLVANDNSVAKILDQKDDFIEAAFKSRVTESRHVQQMYDKFRRYRKREEDKLQRRLTEVRHSGNVGSLEDKVAERTIQLETLSREVAQKEKFYKLVRESSQSSSTDQIRALLELGAQEEIERLMKVLEVQQGDVLRVLMNMDNLHKENMHLKEELAEQYKALAGGNAGNLRLLAKVPKLHAELQKLHSKHQNEEQEKTRLTATVSKALKTILATSLTNEASRANLARVEQESVDLDECKTYEIKLQAARAEMEELTEKKKVLEQEEIRLSELEKEFKEKEAKANEGQKLKKGNHGEDDSGPASGDGESARALTAAFEVVLAKALSVGKGVRLFMDKEEAMAEDEAAALKGWEEEEGGDLPSMDDIAMHHDNVNFAIKLGYKGKDKKTQDKMKLTQAVDQAEFERQKVKYKSYGLNAVLDQVEGIFKLLYIDPDIMQVAAESSDDEDETSEIKHELKSFDCTEVVRSAMAAAEEDDVGHVKNRLKRQETREVVMNDEFVRKYAKQPILNKRYEDIFRNKKLDDASELEDPSGSVGSSMIEFDPNVRREEVFSVAEPGDEGEFLKRLGVNEEGKVERSKESQRQDLFCAHLEVELEDCYKITRELSRKRAVSGKVDSNLSRSSVEEAEESRNLEVEFADVIHESPSCELGVDVYRSCESLAGAIVRRRSSIAEVKEFMGKVGVKAKRTQDILAEKTESRDYAHDTFCRNLKKLESVQKTTFRYKSELDIEKGERLRARLGEELTAWQNNLKTLVAGTEFDIIEEVAEPVNDASETAAVVGGHSEGDGEMAQQKEKVDVMQHGGGATEEHTSSHPSSHSSSLVEDQPVNQPRISVEEYEGVALGQQHQQQPQFCALENGAPPRELVDQQHNIVNETGAPVSQSDTSALDLQSTFSESHQQVNKPAGRRSLEESSKYSVESSHSFSTSRTDRSMQDGMREAVRVLLQDAPMKIAPPSSAAQEEDHPGSRATSSRLRRFRYSGEELADVKRDAMDNTPITPAAIYEADGAMVFVPQGGRTVTSPHRHGTGTRGEMDWQPDGEFVEDSRPIAESYLRLNSPRTGSGPYTPVPHINVREVKASTETFGDDVMASTESIRAPDKPLVTNYFVPKNLLKQTARLAQQMQRWKKVAKDGRGAFQNDNKVPQEGSLAQEAMLVMGAVGGNRGGKGDQRKVVQEASDDSMSTKPTPKMDSFWDEAPHGSPAKVSKARDKKPQNPSIGSDESPSSKHFGVSPHLHLDKMSESLSAFSDITLRLRDPNTNAFPMPKAKKVESLSDTAFANSDMSKKDVAIEKAIITRKILRVSAWDRVVGMKTSFMKQYIQQELRDPRVVRVINAFTAIKRKDQYQDKFEFEDSYGQDTYGDNSGGMQRVSEEEDESNLDSAQAVGERAFNSSAAGREGRQEPSSVRESKTLLKILRNRVHQIIEMERQKLLAEKMALEEIARQKKEEEEKEAARVKEAASLQDMSAAGSMKESGIKEGDEEDDSEEDEVTYMSGMSQSVVKFSVDVSRSSSLMSKSNEPPQKAPKPPPSKYFLDEDSAPPPRSRDTAARGQSGDDDQSSFNDSISMEPLPRGDGSVTLEDSYSSVLKSAVYDLFDRHFDADSKVLASTIAGKSPAPNTGGVDMSSRPNTEDKSLDISRRVKEVPVIQTSSVGQASSVATDDDMGLIVPPSPHQRDPLSEQVASKHGRSLIKIGSSAIQRFKLEEEDTVSDVNPLPLTTTNNDASTLVTSTAESDLPSKSQHATVAFPYQPPSALKPSESLMSPRRKGSKVTTNKVLFTRDLLKSNE